MRFEAGLLGTSLFLALAGCGGEPAQPAAQEEEQQPASVAESPPTVYVTPGTPFEVDPWEVRILPNGYAIWNLTQIPNLESAAFEEKQGQRVFPYCTKQGASQVYRCGEFTQHPDSPGADGLPMLEHYQIHLSFSDGTELTIDPDYRVGPRDAVPPDQGQLQEPPPQ